MIRETTEEIGITPSPNAFHLAHIMHRRSVGVDCTNSERIDFFFALPEFNENAEGTPINRERDKCDDLRWFPMVALPANTVPYVRDAIECYRTGQLYSEHGWDSLCPRCGAK